MFECRDRNNARIAVVGLPGFSVTEPKKIWNLPVVNGKHAKPSKCNLEILPYYYGDVVEAYSSSLFLF